MGVYLGNKSEQKVRDTKFNTAKYIGSVVKSVHNCLVKTTNEGINFAVDAIHVSLYHVSLFTSNSDAGFTTMLLIHY